MSEIHQQNPEVTEHQAEAFEGKKIGLEELHKLGNLKNAITAQIAEASAAFEISTKEKTELEKEIQATSGTKEIDLLHIQKKVDDIRKQSRALTKNIDTVLKRNNHLDLDTASELKKFRSMSLAEKEIYTEVLEQRIEQLQALYKEIGKTHWEKRSESIHKGKEIDFSIELKRQKNLVTYMGFFTNAKNREHFSKASVRLYLKEFSELSLSDQQSWIQSFAVTELAPRAALTKQYREFSKERQNLAGNFFEMGKSEKEKAVQRLMENLEQEYMATLYRNPYAKFVSEQSKMAGFNAVFRPSSGKSFPVVFLENALAQLENHMKAEAKLHEKYERFSHDVIKRYHAMYHKEKPFETRTFEEKEHMLTVLEAIATNVQAEKKEEVYLQALYENLLLKELNAKTIAPKTVKAFTDWFAEQTLTGKKHAISTNAFEGEMKPRRALLLQFQSLPEEIQAAQSDFFNLSNNEREKLMENLQKQLTADHQSAAFDFLEQSPEIQQLMLAAEQKAQNQNYTEAIHLYESILMLDNENKKAGLRLKELQALQGKNDGNQKTALELDTQELQYYLESLTQENEMEIRLRYLAFGQHFARLAQQNDRKNNKSDSTKKTAHLDSSLISLSLELSDTLDGKVVADRDGMATGVIEYNTLNLNNGTVNNGTLQQWKEQTTKDTLGKNGNNAHVIQFTDQNRKNISGQEGEKNVDAEMKTVSHELQKKIASRAAEKQGLNKNGTTLNGKTQQVFEKIFTQSMPERMTN